MSRRPSKAKGALRVARFIGIRTVSVAISLIIAVYLTIFIANIGGHIDEIMKSEITLRVYERLRNDPTWRVLPAEERERIAQAEIQRELELRGLTQPFIVRSFMYLRDALSLNLGRALYITSTGGSKRVWDIILERLPATVLLFTTANVVIFFAEIFIGLTASRKYGSMLDKAIVGMAWMSAMPGWFYGIFLILIFASWLRILPYGGMVDAPAPEDPFEYALSVLKHMILPLLSWLIAYIPIGAYSRRTFFLLFSMEDYVDYARARGVPPRIIERRYILRPTLPPIITGFVLTLIASWMGAMVTETIFSWPGLGTLLREAIGMNDAPVIIGVITIYAYLLAISVIVLDIVYAIVDPRIRVGG
ncbi:MAG: ABC transporter permease [Thermoprotei archaeon]